MPQASSYARKRWAAAFRLVASFGLVAYLVTRVGPSRVLRAWADVPVFAIVGVVVLQLAGVALSTAKWRVIIRGSRPSPPYRWLLASYLSGLFAGNLLPTAVGGDALRIVQLGRRIGNRSAAASTVFFERLTGFLALNALATSGLVALARSGRASSLPAAKLAWVTAGVGLLSGAALWVLSRPDGLARLQGLLPRRLDRAVGDAGPAFVAAAPRGPTLRTALLLSLAFQALWALMHAVGGAALGLDVPLATYVVLATVTDLVGLVPVFFNNLGARETVFTTVLSTLAVPDERALALAFLVLTGRLVVSVVGGVAVGALGWHRAANLARRPDRDQGWLRPLRRTRRRDR